MEGFSIHGNETSDSIECMGFLDQLSDRYLHFMQLDVLYRNEYEVQSADNFVLYYHTT